MHYFKVPWLNAKPQWLKKRTYLLDQNYATIDSQGVDELEDLKLSVFYPQEQLGALIERNL